VPLEHLSEEISRFDIDLAALEICNPSCEAKSELEFLEATLVDVPTIASPTGPFRRAVRHGETGFLAVTLGEWHETLCNWLAHSAALPGCKGRTARSIVAFRAGVAG
jgi:hypothetical protein